MEEVQGKKFQCKFCSKCCFSGKSLGGHMRGHLALISAARKGKVKSDAQMGLEDGDNDHDDDYELEDKNSSRASSAEQSNSSLNAENMENQSSIALGSDDQDQVQESYGLRGNPKKSWKASDLNSDPRKRNICKECCKRFPSSRALAGHMRAHSAKLRDQHLCKKCGKGFDSMRAMYGHMKSHSNSKRSKASSESANGFSDFDIIYPRKKRSALRYKFGQNSPLSNPSVPDELVHAAMGLMMLSRGVGKVSGDDAFVCDLNEVDDSCLYGSGDSFSKQNGSEINDTGSDFPSVSKTKDELGGSIEEPRHFDLEMADSPAVLEPNKSREHECGICLKVFLTGQALGGHMRAHYAGFTESRNKESTNEELQCIQNSCGLNVPEMVAHHQKMVREDVVGLKLWWTGNNSHVADPLLISN